MTDRGGKEKVCEKGAPVKPEGGEASILGAGRQTVAYESVERNEGPVSRRTALIIGSAAMGTSLLPVEAVAHPLAAEAASPEFIERAIHAIEAVRELREIRAELTRCQARILRLDPHSQASREEDERQSGLRYLQNEAETRAFSAANGISCKTPAAFKADIRDLEISLTRYVFTGTVGRVEPDWEGWHRKRQAFWERQRAWRLAKATTAA